MSKWTKKGFEEFSKGTMGNGGQNLYVSAKGTLQRIFNFDVNGDGYPDLPITNSHSMNEKPPIYIFDEAGQQKPLELPTNGSYDAIFVDLYDRGVEDLVVACQHNGVHSDISAIIYFGSEIGLSEKYKMELRVPNSIAVAAGRFDGKKISLAFNSGNKIRYFEQGTHGFEASKFKEFDIATMTFEAGDLDGDGYDDLYAIQQGTGQVVVYWGGEDGINPDRKTVFGEPLKKTRIGATSTTAGRLLLRWVTWRCNIVKVKDKLMTFRAEDTYAIFESFGSDRQPKEEFRIKVVDSLEEKEVMSDYMFSGGGAMHATSGDLRGDGSSDIIISVATGYDQPANTIVLWENENYSFEKATLIPLYGTMTASVGKWGNDGKNYLFLCETPKMHELSIKTSIFAFDEDGKAIEVQKIDAHEPARMISGKTFEDGKYQLAVINHEGENKLGFENVWIYLGGEDGYNTERRLAFPSCAAVDTFMVDLTDNGHPDVVVINCAENAPMLSPGPAIYWQDENGFDTENKVSHFITAEMSHGAAIGDFRKCGYLDIITGALSNRDVKIYEGGPNGYDFEHPKMLVMGPDKEAYLERFGNVEYDYVKVHQAKEHEFENPEDRSNLCTIRWMFAADFNGDGYLDLFVSQIVGDRSFIFWGGPNGFDSNNFQEIATDGISAANAADLNGNGYLDLIVSCHLSKKHTIPNEYGKFVIYWGGPDGYQEHRKTQLPTFCSNALTINDFNGDGLLDIYGTAYNNGRCRDIDSKLYFQSEDRIFHADNYQDIFNHSGCGCLAGDFNGDGYIDLAVASHKAFGNHVNSSYIFWGGEDGINEQRYTELPCRGPHGMCSVDIGNIMDRSNSEYYTSESYKSDTKATKISWEATNGKKTWVKVQLRCADSIETLENAEWSESFENGADISALNFKGYIQYKLELGAYCGAGTPRVTEVTVDFE